VEIRCGGDALPARDERPGRGARGGALGDGPGGSGDHHFGRFAGYSRDGS